MSSDSTDSKNTTGDNAFADDNTNPDLTRGQVVGEPVTTSFDERTSVSQPFVKADGTQDNGAAPDDLAAQEGASRTTSREGDKSTVEETNVAIEEGTITGSQRIGSEEAAAAPKNPVAEEFDTGAPDNVSTLETGKNTKPAKSSK